jgi:demethylmenaquinone methyltransferase/2-methoxy-6-polyprenyl-1,4-benzoquinol methylase
MRIGLWRRKAIEALALRPGDTVVEIGCGTGLNFALLEKAVGSRGRIIGVDISEAMLERAEARVRDAGWNNVELVCCSAADYQFPRGVGGIFATGVLNYEPAYDQLIARSAQALGPGRRWVVLDYKMPKNWLRYLAPAFLFLGSTYGVSRKLMERHPWESIQRHLRNTQMQELYGGFVYIISGEAP